jgi:hypothetical protein
MIHHIMLWNYKDEVSREERAYHEAELVRLVELVPSLRSVRYGPVVGGRNQSFGHCFVMEFDDMAGLAEYASHAAHMKFSSAFKEACAVQVVADFEVANE